MYHDRGYVYEKVKFFLSPLAAAFEDDLAFDLVGRIQPMFGKASPGEWSYAFVLMPFSDELNPLYEDHLKKIATETGFTIGRADDFFTTGSIIQDIWSAIYYASVVIADCTGRNPNVFYEIGVAHTLGRNTVLNSQSLDDVPFDLRHLRVIVYDFTPRGVAEIETALTETLNRSLFDRT